MSDISIESFRSQSASSLGENELICGGQQCKKCGACRDWYYNGNDDDILKRNDANCNCQYMHHHKLVQNRDPDYFHNQYYPSQNLICMCKDNHSK